MLVFYVNFSLLILRKEKYSLTQSKKTFPWVWVPNQQRTLFALSVHFQTQEASGRHGCRGMEGVFIWQCNRHAKRRIMYLQEPLYSCLLLLQGDWSLTLPVLEYRCCFIACISVSYEHNKVLKIIRKHIFQQRKKSIKLNLI